MRFRGKRLWIVTGAAVVVALGALAAFNRGPASTEVQVATVGRKDLQAKVTANGKIQAKKKVDISAEQHY